MRAPLLLKANYTTLLLATLISSHLLAAENPDASAPRPDKSNFNLFNPVPRTLLRELSTDRPDLTESPYTVDVGHFQVEMDLVNYSYDHDKSAGNDTRTTVWSVAPVNLKIGLHNQVDLQLMLGTYSHVKTDDRIAGTVTRQKGFNDVTTRLKVNLWGNDGGTTAFALMPYLKIPASQDNLGNNAFEGGLIMPLAVELPRGWNMGLMTQVDILQNSFSSDYHAESLSTITFGHDIIGKLGGYWEFAAVYSFEKGAPWVGTFDTGLTYAISDDIQLDAGINFGITTSAPDYNPFIGISFRF